MPNFKLLLAIFLCVILLSCSKENPDPYHNSTGPLYLQGKGIFLLNEGNFMSGNGSLSFYSYDSARLYNDIFTKINSRPLGDIPFSMAISGTKAYIVVNNSGKVEIIDKAKALSYATISDLISPRNILFVNSTKAYVSSLYSTKIAILNLVKNTISGYIEIRRTSESMLIVGEKVYVSCWSSGKELMVINPKTDKVTDSIEVGHEPESMVIDKNQRLWILCAGGYSGLYFPELISVNTTSDQIETRLSFQAKTMYPTSLCINKTGDTLYYIEGSIRRFAITESTLPDNSFVPSKGRLFYKLGVDPDNGLIYATNAVDYQQKGYLMRISGKGVVLDSLLADIIPGGLCFKGI